MAVRRAAAPAALALIALALCVGVAAAASEDALTVDEILALAIEAQEQHREAGHETSFDYQLVSVTEKLDGDREVKSEESERYVSHHIDGHAYERMIEKDGRALTEDEIEEEREREQEFRERLEERADDEGDEDEDEERVHFDEDLVSRYEFERAEDDDVGGRTCYRLAFAPREGKLRNERRIDRVLNKARGELWVDAETYQIARLHFRLDEKVRLWWGVLGSVSEMTGRLERRPVDDDAWLPARFELYLRGRMLFRSLHFRQHITWEDFARREPPATTTPIDKELSP